MNHPNHHHPIRPKVLIASLSLLGPILLFTYIFSHLFSHTLSSSAFASAVSSDNPCIEAKAAVSRTQSWVNLYQPLAARGGIYRTAYQENLSQNEAALKRLSACSN